MPSFTNYTDNKVLDHVRGKTAWTLPTVYVGLSSTTPAVGGTNVTELSTGSYARVSAPGTSYNAAAGGVSTNSATLTFPTSTAAWLAGASLTYAVFFDASTGGNLLFYSVLGTPQAVAASGITITVPASSDSLSLS